MKLWPRLLAVCALLAVSLLFATQGQLGRVGELPLWYWAIFALLAALSFWQILRQPLDSLQGRARGVWFGSAFGVMMFLLNLSEQVLKSHPDWGKPFFTGAFVGLLMGWIYSYSGQKRSGLERGKQG
ncbi:hypothetical protein EHF33_00350 [Deinococcus psychrotolerans]|uniref:TIGR04086 family membrane protein n=1 Tax=Deinococcus psychrotolerans TaxID=2489213 RepID=A0A3G8Y8W1_9DEIO|nr:hypothetical protein [Deinococcus psychrotolerans]AZI41390.1 hypothetical protein EHF33_00350 [Deinococcus psychrotolerans]